MKRYLLLIPIFGIFLPPYFENWDEFVKDNNMLFNCSTFVHILSILLITVICS
jgi:hypothetical protein